MRKNSLINWEFADMLYKYLEHRPYFYWKYNYNESYPFQYDLKIITSLVNAFTDNHFDITNNDDRDSIQDLVEFGFGMEDQLCTEEQLICLRDLFPERAGQFVRLIENKPNVGELYCILFDILRYGHEYITTFSNVNYPPEANIVYTFKREEADKAIDDNDDVIIEAIKILLGNDFCSKTFTIQELQDKYNYPKLDCKNEI